MTETNGGDSMRDEDLINALQGMARHCVSVNHQENLTLKKAARRLQQLTAPARLLSYEEIQQLPEFAVVWEEWRGWEDEYRENGLEIAPVARMGSGLAGNGIITYIAPDMMDGDEDGQSRWWTAMPTAKQREETPWKTHSAENQSPIA